MSFWNNPYALEPLKQNRWYISFSGQNGLAIDKATFALKECTKPEYKIETSSHVLINHTFNYPKNLVWSPINVTMVSAVGVSHIIDNIISASGYVAPTGEEAQNYTISKTKAVFGGLKIIQIGPDGKITDELEVWELKNAFITSVNYGNLSYENENFVDIKFTITYDYAILSQGKDAVKSFEDLLKAADLQKTEQEKKLASQELQSKLGIFGSILDKVVQ